MLVTFLRREPVLLKGTPIRAVHQFDFARNRAIAHAFVDAPDARVPLVRGAEDALGAFLPVVLEDFFRDDAGHRRLGPVEERDHVAFLQ